MFGKRILNVEVYGDQTIYGIKSFKDKIVVPEKTLFFDQISDIDTYITNQNFVTSTILTNALAYYATLASITLSYGVWLLVGQAGIYNSSGAAASCVMTNKQIGISNSATAFETKYQSRAVGTNTLGIGAAACEQANRIVTVTNSSTPYYLLAYVNYSVGTLQTQTNLTNFYAVRLA